MLKKLTIAAVSTLLLAVPTAHARDQIRAVGSSTVYPFITVAGEEFGRSGKFKTPIVESTGTGGGFKLFCAGVGDTHPDIANASRAIKDSEVELCKKNGVNDITEIKIGFDGIVLANSTKASRIDITREQIFKALARKIPQNGKLVDNPYQKWSEIDKSLPNVAIEVYGPPPTSGTRDAFVELVMHKACEHFSEFTAAFPDKQERERACGLIREDGKFIEAGENDNLIVQKLVSNKNAFGIFGYSFLEENGEIVQGSLVDGQDPAFGNISNGNYPVSRPLFVYVKKAHLALVPGLKEFVRELISEKAIGTEGYLSQRGLIALHDKERKEVETKVLAEFK